MGCEERLIADWWPREHEAVLNLPHSREANGRNVKWREQRNEDSSRAAI